MALPRAEKVQIQVRVPDRSWPMSQSSRSPKAYPTDRRVNLSRAMVLDQQKHLEKCPTLDTNQGVDECTCIWSEDVATDSDCYRWCTKENGGVRWKGLSNNQVHTDEPSTFHGFDTQLVMARIICISEHVEQERHDRPVMLRVTKNKSFSWGRESNIGIDIPSQMCPRSHRRPWPT